LENYLGNLFSEELQILREENEILIEEKELNEGAETLAELLAPYSEKTQDIVISLIKEGNSEEVTMKMKLMKMMKNLKNHLKMMMILT